MGIFCYVYCPISWILKNKTKIGFHLPYVSSFFRPLIICYLLLCGSIQNCIFLIYSSASNLCVSKLCLIHSYKANEQLSRSSKYVPTHSLLPVFVLQTAVLKKISVAYGDMSLYWLELLTFQKFRHIQNNNTLQMSQISSVDTAAQTFRLHCSHVNVTIWGLESEYWDTALCTSLQLMRITWL